MTALEGPRAVSLLIIEDEPQIRRVVRRCLAGEAARVLEAESGRLGIEIAVAERPDLIVLDLGLPDLAGLDVCRKLRRDLSVPILVLSARHSDQEKALLLDAGADDFICKPFSVVELTARVRAHLRRTHTWPEVLQADGDLIIDLQGRTVKRQGRSIHLTSIEWKLLQILVVEAGRTLTHQQLFRAAWGRAHDKPQEYLRVYVAHLRRKVERDPVRPRLLLTEPGVGYRLELS